MSVQISGPVVLPDGSVTAAKISSAGAADGQVPTADGSGGVAWEELPAAVGGILATGATIGATSQAQVFTNGVGVGVTSPMTALQVATSLTTSPRGIMSSQHSAGVDGARFHMRKSRGTSASPTVITAGDVLGRLVASGYDGANYLEMGGIDVVSAGTIASTRVPTEIRFLTATDAAPSVLTQRMVIDKVGNVGIGTTAPVSNLTIDGTNTILTTSQNLQIRTNDAFGIDFGGSVGFGGKYNSAGDFAVWAAVSGRKENATDGNTSGYLTLSTRLSGGSTLERARITSTGNVGIGTTAPTAALHVPASTTTRASLRIPAGTAPTIPNAGDVWAEGDVLKFYNGTTTKEIAFV